MPAAWVPLLWDAVTAAKDMEVVCGIDPFGGEAPFATYKSIDEALQGSSFDVLVDFYPA